MSPELTLLVMTFGLVSITLSLISLKVKYDIWKAARVVIKNKEYKE